MSGPSSSDVPGGTGGSHYFSQEPAGPSRPSAIRLDLPDLSLDLMTDRGMFSPDRVDPGTKLLLSELPALRRGPVVDVGCGYGPIACTIARRHPSLEVLAVDVNARARALCARNADSLGLEIAVLAPDEVPTGLEVAAIVSNPPIRIGKRALHALLDEWLARLVPDGHAFLVVHKNLGADSLQRWLREQGREVQRTRSRQGYRVLVVGGPPGGDGP